MSASAVPGPPGRFDNVNLLRAFAAFSVLFFHLIARSNWESFPSSGPLAVLRAGWYGVDLFFVVSGFVITYSALLLYRGDRARFAGVYWARRLTRILPLYLVTMAAYIAIFWLGPGGTLPGDWPRQVLTHLAFIHNFSPETFGTIDAPNWSLAIEMQFYLAVALLIGWLDRTPGWRIALLGVAIAWAWRLGAALATRGEPEWFTLVRALQLPGVLDEFGMGIFLAKLVLDGPPASRRRTIAWVVGACATGWISIEWYLAHASIQWSHLGTIVFWRTSLAVLFACVVATAIELPQVIARRWAAPIDYLGEVSYGIYLWHFFGVAFAVNIQPNDPLRALGLAVALTLSAAMFSWRTFEKPLMRLARRDPATSSTRA